MAPALASASLLVFVVLDMIMVKPQNKVPYLLLMTYLLATAVSWISGYSYFMIPRLFMYGNSLSMLMFMSMPILLYNLIYEATKLESDDKFDRRHFILPVSLAFLILFTSFFTPAKDQLEIILSRGKYRGYYTFFFWISSFRMPLRLILSIVYTIFGFIRLHKYREKVFNYSSNADKISLSWVFWLLLLSVSLIQIPLLGSIIERMTYAHSYWLYLQGLVLIFQNAYLCSYVIRWQKVVYHPELILPEKQEELHTSSEEGAESPLGRTHSGLSKEVLVAYMESRKPYLNPDLRIADMAMDLGVNRTYVSSLINDEFRMNFSCFINRYRFHEFKKLAQEPEYAVLTKAAQAEMAGFNSFRSFLRYQKMQESGECQQSID